MTRNLVRTWSQTETSIEGSFQVRSGRGGSVYVSGTTRSLGGADKLVLLKFEGAGRHVAGNSTIPSSVAVDGKGRIYVAGTAHPGGDILLVQYAPVGGARPVLGERS